MSNQVHANGPAGHASAPSKAAQAGGKAFSAAAKRDPALLPLALIVGAGLSTAAYFFSTKQGSSSGKGEAVMQKHFAGSSIEHPWQGDGKGALYKYRYMSKDGKVNYAQPATSYEVVPHSGNIDKLKAYTKKHTSDHE